MSVSRDTCWCQLWHHIGLLSRFIEWTDGLFSFPGRHRQNNDIKHDVTKKNSGEVNFAWRRTLNIVMMVICERGGWGEKHEGRQQVWPRWLEMKVWDLSPCSAQRVESGGEQIEPWDASWYWLSVSVCFGFWFLVFWLFLYICAWLKANMFLFTICHV